MSGTGALHEFRRDFDVAKVVGSLVGRLLMCTPADALRPRIAAQEEEMKKLRRELDAVRMKAAASSVADAAASAVEVKGVKVLAQRVDGLEKAQMRESGGLASREAGLGCGGAGRGGVMGRFR